MLPKAKGKVAGGVRATEGIAGEASAGGMEGRAGESGPSISYSKRHDSGPSKPTASSSSGKSPEVGLESSIERVRANPNLLRNYARLIEESTDAKIPEVQFNLLKKNLRAEGYTKISKEDWAIWVFLHKPMNGEKRFRRSNVTEKRYQSHHRIFISQQGSELLYLQLHGTP